MFDRWRWTVLAAASCVATSAAAAQRAALPNQDSSLADIRRLDTLLVQRDAALLAARTAYFRDDQWVDVVEGALHVRTTAALAERVRAGARMATVLIDARGGEVLRARLATRVPMVGTDSMATFLGTKWWVWFASDTGQGLPGRTRLYNIGLARSEMIGDHLTRIAEQLAVEGMDSAFTAWLMVGQLPLRDGARSRREAAYIELSTNPSATLRRCRSGDAAACLTSLGLLEGDAENRFDAWYAPEDYRALVSRLRIRWADSTLARAAERCRSAFEAESCALAAHAVPRDRLPQPLSAESRRLFLEEVLRNGGREAYARLVSSGRPLRERLAEAAGAPLDTIARKWLARVLDARPEPMRVDAGLFLVAAGWCAVFTSIAITRRAA